MIKCLVGLFLALGVASAQNAPSPQTPAQPQGQPQTQAQTQAQAQKDAKKRLGLLATRAISNFHSADSIEASLSQEGLSLHPQLVSLRLRIEAALDEAQTAVDHGNTADAKEALDTAQALLDRYVQRLGGA
jgi:ElaB/YqjD/DUF883 family membrane-anchored ribosome-binding protein